MDLATLNSKVISYSRKKPGYIRKVYMEDIQDAAKDAYTYASMANDIFINQVWIKNCLKHASNILRMHCMI